MQRIPVLIVSLFLLFCMHLTGCGKKTQEVDNDSQNDLFVEYHEYYFPEKIETLALGELAGYRGRLESPFPSKRGARNRHSARNYRRVALPSNLPETRRQLLRCAESAIGTPYVLGGMSPGGFDCSGLVCWVYGNAGVKLPRTAREQSVVGAQVNRLEDMQAGDIVTFRHPKRGYHSGIYVGNGKFIHSPRQRSRVKINSLDDPYFHNTFLSARRVNIGSRENLLAQAERRLSRDESSLSTSGLNREYSQSSRNASLHRRSHASSSKQDRERNGRKITVAVRSDRDDSYRNSDRHSRGERRNAREERSSRRDRREAREERSSRRDRREAREERSSKRDRRETREERSSKRDRSEAREERSSKRDRREAREERSSKRDRRMESDRKDRKEVGREQRRRDDSVGRSRKAERASDRHSKNKNK